MIIEHSNIAVGPGSTTSVHKWEVTLQWINYSKSLLLWAFTWGGNLTTFQISLIINSLEIQSFILSTYNTAIGRNGIGEELCL